MNKALVWVAVIVVAVIGIVIWVATASRGSTPAAAGLAPGSSGSLGTPGEFTCESGSLTASGSTALAPLVQAVAQQYQARCSSASITVNLGGSGTGLANAENGVSDIGDSDIFSKTGQEDLVDHQVAAVVFTLVVNKDVSADNLTTSQIQDIYRGKVTNWRQVGGSNRPIVVVSRPPSSGTRATFQNYVLGTVESVSGPQNLVTDSTGTVIENVQKVNGAIGYVTSGAAKQAGMKMLSIDGVAPSFENVKTNRYKFWNIEHMYTKGQATDREQAFIDYMTSDGAKASAARLDYATVDGIPSETLATHQQH